MSRQVYEGQRPGKADGANLLSSLGHAYYFRQDGGWDRLITAGHVNNDSGDLRDGWMHLYLPPDPGDQPDVGATGRLVAFACGREKSASVPVRVTGLDVATGRYTFAACVATAEFFGKPRPCACPTADLMVAGCKCGHFTREGT